MDPTPEDMQWVTERVRKLIQAGVDEETALSRALYAMNLSRIYIASKTKHAPRWRRLRDRGVPIISTWIDDPVDKAPGGAVDHADLWSRCISEASNATAIIVYVESSNEVLKGAYVEVGAALAHGVPVFLVGDPSGTCWHHRLVTRCEDMAAAIRLACPGASDPSLLINILAGPQVDR